MRILVFGDSITQGLWDSEGGWTNRLRKFYDKKFISGENDDPPLVFNLGISGDVTEGVLNRLDNEINARKWRWPEEDFSLVIAIGTNDTIVDNGTERSSPEEYEQKLKALLEKARNFSSKILFVGLTPVEEKIANERVSKTKRFYNDRIRQFDKTLREFCNAENVPCVNVLETFQDKLSKGENLLSDGLHPNEKGHQLIFEKVKPVLEELLK